MKKEVYTYPKSGFLNMEKDLSTITNLILNNNLTMLDLNTFVVSLQDYLLKIADVVEVKLQEELIVKRPKVRSLKQDARNSGSGNSKTNTKNKNTKKKNKKR